MVGNEDNLKVLQVVLDSYYILVGCPVYIYNPKNYKL